MFYRVFSKRNRVLLAELVRTDFKLRYQGSVLGYAWSLLRPLMLFGILYVVFAVVLKSGGNIPYFPAYLLLGIVIWNFFTEMTQQSLGSVVGRGDLIRKIKIPRWMVVFSTSMSALINLGLNLVVVFIAMILNHVQYLMTAPLLILILIEVYFFALGISLFLSAAFVKYRDITYIWEVVLQAGFYLTPILFSMSLPILVSHPFIQKLLMINPMAQAIQDARYVTISHSRLIVTAYNTFQGKWYVIIPFVLVSIIFISGVAYFRKHSKYFAENI